MAIITNLQKILLTLTQRQFPFHSCFLVDNQPFIKIGDNVIRQRVDGLWTGRFYDIEFTLNADNVCWLIENDYLLACYYKMAGKLINEDNVEEVKKMLSSSN